MGNGMGNFLVKVAEIVKGRTEALERVTRSHLSVLFTLKSVSSFSTSTGHSTGQECHKIMVSTCDSLMSSAHQIQRHVLRLPVICTVHQSY